MTPAQRDISRKLRIFNYAKQIGKEKRLTKFCWRSYNQIRRQPRSFPAQ